MAERIQAELQENRFSPIGKTIVTEIVDAAPLKWWDAEVSLQDTFVWKAMLKKTSRRITNTTLRITLVVTSVLPVCPLLVKSLNFPR